MSGTLTQVDAVSAVTATTTNVLIADGTGVVCRQTAVYVLKIDAIVGTWNAELFYVYADGSRQRIASALANTMTGRTQMTADAPFIPPGPIPTVTTAVYTNTAGILPSLTATVFGFYGD